MIRLSAISLAAAIAMIMPARAEPATLLGVYQNWSAFSSGTGSSMTCYALSRPMAKRPVTAKRSDIWLMVSDWPNRKIRSEPQIVLGYPVKQDSPASLSVGSAKFDFFARPSGTTDGVAWLQVLGDNNRLIETMGKGVSAVATGTSARGTKTTDTYSLAGFADAMAKVHDTCKT